jgi:hypothetical protein
VEMNVILTQPAIGIRVVEIHAKGQVTRVDQDTRAQICGFAAMNRTVLIRGSIEHVIEQKDLAVQSSTTPQRVRDIGLHRCS